MSKIAPLISIILLAVFILAYSLKLLIMKKINGINANVLAKGKKVGAAKMVEQVVRLTSFAGMAVWAAAAIYRLMNPMISTDSLPMNYISIMGILLTLAGVIFFVAAAWQMKLSWRVGIDKVNRTELVTTGLYKISRNPAFVGFNLMFAGVFLTFPGTVTFISMLTNAICFHLLIKQEEKHLAEMVGKEYSEYMKKTNRYLGF